MIPITLLVGLLMVSGWVRISESDVPGGEGIAVVECHARALPEDPFLGVRSGRPFQRQIGRRAAVFALADQAGIDVLDGFVKALRGDRVHRRRSAKSQLVRDAQGFSCGCGAGLSDGSRKQSGFLRGLSWGVAGWKEWRRDCVPPQIAGLSEIFVTRESRTSGRIRAFTAVPCFSGLREGRSNFCFRSFKNFQKVPQKICSQPRAIFPPLTQLRGT